MSKFLAIVGNRCVACGVCTKVCPKSAIAVKDGVKAVVKDAMCVGCGLCVQACPAGIIKKVERSSHE